MAAMIASLPIRYVDPVFRPPSEAESLILPVTDGCSWNQCTFCQMYKAPQKKFRARDQAETMTAIRACGEHFGNDVRRVFLADGDALVLPTRRLIEILGTIQDSLPAVRRVSSYCLPRNLRRKSAAELKELADAGLTMAYVGAESGDDEVLAKVHKGETFVSTCAALDKLQLAGIQRSVMILNGLGGRMLSQRHAENSARLVNATQPEYLSTLVLNFPQGEEHFRKQFPAWQPCSQRELFAEMETFISALELRRTVFRSDHVSNRLVLKGTLGAEKSRLLKEIRAAVATPEAAGLRRTWAQGL